MGIIAQVVGILGMLLGGGTILLNFYATGPAAVYILPYGTALFISALIVACIGRIVEQVQMIRASVERQTEFLKSSSIK